MSIVNPSYVTHAKLAGNINVPNNIKAVLDSIIPIINDGVLLKATEFSNLSTYAVGTWCKHDGTLHVCHTAITASGEWTGSINWTTMSEVSTYFSKSNISLMSVLPYEINTEASIKDRAINVQSGVSFSIPEKFKDLLIRFTVSDTAPTITFNGEDVGITEYGDNFPSASDTGEYLMTVTRIASNECYICVMKLEERS